MYKVCIADDEEFVLESVRWRIQQSVIELEIAGVARNGLRLTNSMKRYARISIL